MNFARFGAGLRELLGGPAGTFVKERTQALVQVIRRLSGAIRRSQRFSAASSKGPAGQSLPISLEAYRRQKLAAAQQQTRRDDAA